MKHDITNIEENIKQTKTLYYNVNAASKLIVKNSTMN